MNLRLVDENKQISGMSASNNLSAVLVNGAKLPLRFWRSRFYFTGAGDLEIFPLTGGRFPAKPISGKTHPIFVLEMLPNGAGSRVCPCSSKKPRNRRDKRSIREGCPFLYTGFVSDKRSYLIESITLNIPTSIAYSLRFRGEVPESCIETADDN